MPKIKSSTPWLPLYIALALGLVALVAFFYFSRPGTQAISPGSQAGPAVRKEHIQQQALEPLPEENQLPSSEPKPPEQYRQAPMEASLEDPCLDIIKKLDRFFIYLDEQDYIQAYRFPQGSKEYLASLAQKALASPPAPMGPEPSTLERLANQAHLFRTLGSQNLVILRAIIAQEPDRLEDLFSDFYSWHTMSSKCQHRLYTINPELSALYSYALFFLHSPGGQAYLARRAPTVRLLTSYYSLLIVQQARTMGLDQSGFDATAIIGKLISEIESSTELVHSQTYLTTLYKLREEMITL